MPSVSFTCSVRIPTHYHFFAKCKQKGQTKVTELQNQKFAIIRYVSSLHLRMAYVKNSRIIQLGIARILRHLTEKSFNYIKQNRFHRVVFFSKNRFAQSYSYHSTSLRPCIQQPRIRVPCDVRHDLYVVPYALALIILVLDLAHKTIVVKSTIQ